MPNKDSKPVMGRRDFLKKVGNAAAFVGTGAIGVGLMGEAVYEARDTLKDPVNGEV